jgi:hypothetical protein
MRMSALHFPRGSFLKALGCAFVRFQFRHKNSAVCFTFRILNLGSDNRHSLSG